jgi:hypothetical protein
MSTFVDLSTWEQQGDLSNGDWTLSNDNVFVTQLVNSDPTYYVSPNNFINGTVTGVFSVNTTADDDFIGFVFGYQSPVADLGDTPNDYDFLVFDWKQEAQNYPNGTSASEGFTLSRVEASDTTNITSSDFYNHEVQPGFEVLATDYGSGKGWEDNITYNFELTYNTDRIIIEIDNNVIFDITGTFEPGRFGFYNLSQEQVEYGQFTSVGAPPTAVADNYLIPVGTSTLAVSTSAEGVLANDSSGTLNPLSATLVSSPSNGTLSTTLSSDGTFTYTPNPGFVGTDSFTYQATDGSNATNPVTVTIQVEGSTTGTPAFPDFNGDNNPDLFWRNTVLDDISIWYMENVTSVGGGFVELDPGSSWEAVSVGDFDTDGQDDLVWFNKTTGEISIWNMNGLAPDGGGILSVTVDPSWNWELKGVGDFDKDSYKDDLIWRNSASGENVIWYMDGTTPTTNQSLPDVPVGGWDIAGVGDFEGTGIQDDVIWRNYNTGENRIWLMDGSTPNTGVDLLSIPDLNWRIEGAIDINTDGASDLLWRNYATGETLVWYMNGTNSTTSANIVPQVTNVDWEVTV